MPEKRECKFCDRVWAVFGIALGAVFVYVSVDLMTGGKVTGMLTRRGQEVISDDATE